MIMKKYLSHAIIHVKPVLNMEMKRIINAFSVKMIMNKKVLYKVLIIAMKNVYFIIILILIIFIIVPIMILAQ